MTGRALGGYPVTVVYLCSVALVFVLVLVAVPVPAPTTPARVQTVADTSGR